jgi:hypothetical protein
MVYPAFTLNAPISRLLRPATAYSTVTDFARLRG